MRAGTASPTLSTIDDDWRCAMSSPWLARPGDRRAPQRKVVHESWERAKHNALDPEHLEPHLEVAEDALAEYRREHPLSLVLPVIRKLLVRDAEGSGLLVAVGDEMGRLLWVEGDSLSKRRAEDMRFVEGAGWSERQVGTSAPGTALELDHGIQIHDSEHFSRQVHGWSCTAVPVHDPETRRILGVIDITGDARAVDPHTLPLIEAPAAAAEAELMVLRLRALADASARPVAAARPRRVTGFGRSGAGAGLSGGLEPSGGSAFSGAPTASGVLGLPGLAGTERRSARTRVRPRPVSMHVLGRDTGVLGAGDVSVELSTRHSELLTVLAWNPEGLSAANLAAQVYGDESATLTLRPEIVRLRRVLRAGSTGLDIQSRPYRLTAPLELDAHHVTSLLDRGAHRVALAAYRGPLLPESVAPGIEQLRAELRARLREAILGDAAIDVLLDYAATADGLNDAEVWIAALRLLPPRSPKRAGVMLHIERLAADAAPSA